MSLYGIADTGSPEAHQAYAEVAALGHRQALLLRLRRQKEARKQVPVLQIIKGAAPVERPADYTGWFWPITDRNRRLKVEDVQSAVAIHYDIRRFDMVSDRRTADVTLPRQIAMYLAKQFTHRSLPEIGRKFGRDHTTVLHAIRKITNLAQFDEKIASDLLMFKAVLAPDLEGKRT